MAISPNVSPGSYLVPIGVVPATVQGADPVATDWVSVGDYAWHVLSAVVGATAGVVISAQQAKDGSGTGAKAIDIDGAASVAFIASTDDNTSKLCVLDRVDYEGGFGFLQITFTPSDKSDFAGALIGVGPRYEDIGKSVVVPT
ncbi:MAG TPA: hypothetical protein VFG53_00080 [Anaeromyxobacter sp.]|nr:hypothetical protein [Anaeromyxobacter sp.]